MLGVLLSATLALAAADVDVPENDGWVTDLAGMLDERQEAALESLMESYKAGTRHEIALLTVPSLEGQPIERLALETARAWGIGGEQANDGALLVVARDERRIRIEVGRGLEGTLTDSVAGRIVRDVIRPNFRRGDFARGLTDGITTIHAAIGGDYGPLRRHETRGPSVRGLAGCLPLLFFALIFFSVMASRRRGRGSGGLMTGLLLGSMLGGRGGGGFSGGGGLGGGGGFSGFGGGGGFSGGGASGGW